VFRSEYAENDRARAEGKTVGLCKVMIVKGKPVGASIVGEKAGDLISIWALAISKGLKVADVAGYVAPYPTYGELPKRAAGAYFGPRLFESDFVKRVVGLLAKLG
ncbi:MAG: dihydrolipoamide dehydrogenase, partial [Pseudomonadota bacterium]